MSLSLLRVLSFRSTLVSSFSYQDPLERWDLFHLREQEPNHVFGSRLGKVGTIVKSLGIIRIGVWRKNHVVAFVGFEVPFSKILIGKLFKIQTRKAEALRHFFHGFGIIPMGS